MAGGVCCFGVWAVMLGLCVGCVGVGGSDCLLIIGCGLGRMVGLGLVSCVFNRCGGG